MSEEKKKNKKAKPAPGQIRFIECTRRRIRLEERRQDGWWKVTSTGMDGMPISLLMHEQYLKTYSHVETPSTPPIEAKKPVDVAKS